METTELLQERSGNFGGGDMKQYSDEGSSRDDTDNWVASAVEITPRRHFAKEVRLLPNERMGWWSAQKFDRRSRRWRTHGSNANSGARMARFPIATTTAATDYSRRLDSPHRGVCANDYSVLQAETSPRTSHEPHRKRVSCPVHLPVVVWVPEGLLPRDFGYVRLDSAKYRKWQVLAPPTFGGGEPAYTTPTGILQRPPDESEDDMKARRAQENNESLSRRERAAIPRTACGEPSAGTSNDQSGGTDATNEALKSLFEPGHRVWLYIDRVKPGLTKKLAPRWHGPFRIKKKLEEYAYELELPDRRIPLLPSRPCLQAQARERIWRPVEDSLGSRYYRKIAFRLRRINAA
ncbi:unnamed protein product [Phytophthora lilii]|uniref:Unnamed protein product n=1 Tax=Phytophthora lilii TaxID=2077276 RepID=A0A9W6TRZ1_9STRA|nr:unnamed protein product [Phytophthora lilii]